MPPKPPQLASELEILQDKKGTPYLRLKKADLYLHCTKSDQFAVINSQVNESLSIALKTATQTFGTRPYDHRLIDSLIIQAFGTFCSEDDNGQDKRCTSCQRGNGMYAECIRIPDAWRGVCGCCRRRGIDIECSHCDEYEKYHDRTNLYEKEGGPASGRRSEGRSLRENVRQPAKYSK